jgi:hypothetical protein
MRPEVLDFDRGDLHAVLDRMARLTDQRRGWINLEPVVDDETPVPLCTWSAPEQRRRRLHPPVVGIQHHVGRKVTDAVAVPDGWVVVQDHGRRGLVVHVPPAEPAERVLAWLLDAAEALCPVPVVGWAASVFAVVG